MLILSIQIVLMTWAQVRSLGILRNRDILVEGRHVRITNIGSFFNIQLSDYVFVFRSVDKEQNETNKMLNNYILISLFYKVNLTPYIEI